MPEFLGSIAGEFVAAVLLIELLFLPILAALYLYFVYRCLRRIADALDVNIAAGVSSIMDYELKKRRESEPRLPVVTTSAFGR